MKIFNKLKLFLLLAVIIILWYSFVTQINTPLQVYKLINHYKVNVSQENVSAIETKYEMKYILLWTSTKNVPFVYIGEGQKGFIERKCPHTNCYATGDKTYLKDITEFDVIAFAGPEVIHMNHDRLPQKRVPHQKYAFATIESSDYYPVCSNRFDDYFNWTWTFKLDSEVRWGYLTVRDKENNIVGPHKEMHWIKTKDMGPVRAELKEQLKSKTKAAAWFVSNCRSRSNREKITKELQDELNKYNLTLDIYGKCGSLTCSRENEDDCYKLLKDNYYFYLSFENSFSEDYVTEKLLNAVQHDTVPIVFGAANYSRFLPDGSYLNAKEMGPKKLAAKMADLIEHPEKYAEYFRWTSHYSYHKQSESVETEPYCLFCTILNNEDMMNEHTAYKQFREWWDPPNRC